mmetsp:Transcript_33877/g.81485  ORF Transcript_33877/g.81485 Transcript_33877/m.81485 type:complete len:243 (+) Transcript_33877:1387-2115(+)
MANILSVLTVILLDFVLSSGISMNNGGLTMLWEIHPEAWQKYFDDLLGDHDQLVRTIKQTIANIDFDVVTQEAEISVEEELESERTRQRQQQLEQQRALQLQTKTSNESDTSDSDLIGFIDRRLSDTRKSVKERIKEGSTDIPKTNSIDSAADKRLPDDTRSTDLSLSYFITSLSYYTECQLYEVSYKLMLILFYWFSLDMTCTMLGRSVKQRFVKPPPSSPSPPPPSTRQVTRKKVDSAYW